MEILNFVSTYFWYIAVGLAVVYFGRGKVAQIWPLIVKLMGGVPLAPSDAEIFPSIPPAMLDKLRSMGFAGIPVAELKAKLLAYVEVMKLLAKLTTKFDLDDQLVEKLEAGVNTPIFIEILHALLNRPEN